MKNKRFFILKSGLFVALSLLISSVTFSQNAANFSGSWVFDEAKSNPGDGGMRMTSQKLEIIQDENSFSIERAFSGQDGTERKMSETYTLDGKESLNPIFNTSKKSKAAWSNDMRTLTVSSLMIFEMNGESNEITTVEVYNLADAGETLSIDSQSATSMGERKSRLVYQKQ